MRASDLAGVSLRLTLVVLLGGALTACAEPTAEPRVAAYSEVLAAVHGDRVARAVLGDERITVELKPEDGGGVLVADRIAALDSVALVDDLEARGVPFSAPDARAARAPALWMFAVLGAFASFIVWSLRREGRRGREAGTIGRGPARVTASAPGARLADVAGAAAPKAAMAQIARQLEARARDDAAKVTHGVLLVGPPGSGKTLLARATAGEAEAPLFVVGAVESAVLFGDGGAAAARDLFADARRHAPCVVLIEDLPGAGVAPLLGEMDALCPRDGVVVVATTARHELLPAGVTARGRFDHVVRIALPDVHEREAILRLHARRSPLAEDVRLAEVARKAAGMMAAELVDVLSEAAELAAARGPAPARVSASDLALAVACVHRRLDPARSALAEEARRGRLALHEAARALVTLALKHAGSLERATILQPAPADVDAAAPPLDVLTRRELRDRVCVLLSGRAAELLVLGELSTCGAHDLARATTLATSMVREFGMSESFGPVTVDRARASELADAEIRELLTTQLDHATALLERHRPTLDALRDELIQHECLMPHDVRRVVGRALEATTHRASKHAPANDGDSAHA